MNFIAHRINTISELKQVPHEYGVEIDLRDHANKIVLQHDPFIGGENFETFLKSYRHQTLILNIKSERIEMPALELLKKYKIKNYFFLDSSFPMIVSLVKQGEHKIALRYSEYESLETILSLKGKIQWVWVDCFTKLPLNKTTYTQLKKAGFKICLVSPELQGRPEDIQKYKTTLNKNGIKIDAVCTKLKNIPLWK